MKKLDILIIITTVICSVIMYIPNHYNSATDVLIELNGKLYATYTIDLDRKIIVRSEFGENVIQIKNKSVSVVESTCKDKIEIKSGPIDKAGESLICLPNKLVITLKGDEDTVVNTY